MILLIDNYDSFVHNLARYFERLGQPTRVVRNDAVDLEWIARSPPQAIVLSPGPGTPDQAGCCLELTRRFAGQVPLLGVCLGHQAIVAALGGSIVRATEPVHGRTSPITHDGQGLFEQLPNPLQVCRYHSLIAAGHDLPPELVVTAQLQDGTIMGVRHRQQPVFGLQFHPEAALTEGGYALLANFLRILDLPFHDPATLASSEMPPPAPAAPELPDAPVTF